MGETVGLLAPPELAQAEVDHFHYEVEAFLRLRENIESRLPAAVRVQDLPEEKEVQKEFLSELGSISMGQTVERSAQAEEKKTVSILDQLEWAKHGNSAALEENVSLALAEAILEVGVNEVRIQVDHEGEFVQNDHRLKDIIENTMRFRPGNHPTLHQVTSTEGLNLSTMHMLRKNNYFDRGYVWVVPRLIPVNTPASALRDYGYFENLAVSWGVVWKETDDSFVMRTLFTAGVNAEEGDEINTRQMTEAELDAMIEQRLTRRHDLQAVTGMYEALGLPVPDNTFDFQRGVILHKSQFSHAGEYDVDIAQLYDDQLGPEFFLGRKAPRENYVLHSRRSIQNMASLDEKKAAVVAEMLARREEITDEMSACYLLAQIVRRHAIDHVIDNPEISAAALGQVAAKQREQYWHYIQQNNFDAAQQTRQDIHKSARTNMCGFGQTRNEYQEALRKENDATNSTAENDETSDDAHGTIRCIKCRDYVQKKDVVKKDSWQCPNCRYEVDVCTGAILNKGQNKAVRSLKKAGPKVKRKAKQLLAGKR